MDLYIPGRMDWADSQLIYHALAGLGRESLTLVYPDRPYVSLGFSQEPVRELDLDFCREAGLPLFRREVGGGTVLLDERQLFFQVVLKRNHPLVCANRESFYRRLLAPPIRVLNRLRIEARFQPINDIAVRKRKISGTAAGEIGECVAFVGNIILDFDSALMSRILLAPDRFFQDRLERLMAESMGSLTTELGATRAKAWDHRALSELLIEEFSRLLGPLREKPLDPQLLQAMARQRERMLSPARLHGKGRRTKGRRVKIRSGLELVQETHQTLAGPLKATYEAENGRVRNLRFEPQSGPPVNRDILALAEAGLEGGEETALEEALAGVQAGFVFPANEY